jgi:hypothetical protein
MKARRGRLAAVLLASALGLWAATEAGAGSGGEAVRAPGRPGEEWRPHPAYRLLGRLIRVPPQITVLEVSSHNKKGLNGDANWPLYRDGRGDEVIFDAAGPGCIRSMWGTDFDPKGVMNFYFDGEAEPRFRVGTIDFFRGRHPLFPAPLVSYEKRGLWGEAPYAGNSFVPIPFVRSLKISITGQSRFFHIIYETYPYPAEFEALAGLEDRTPLADAFERMGERPFEASAGEAFTTSTESVEPGQTVSLLNLDDRPGVIREIEIEADGGPDFFRETWLRMRWDGHERWDVQAPPGLLFGTAVKADDMRSLPLRVEPLPGGKVRLRSFFPMPFWDNAEIEWTNSTSRRMAPLKARILVGGTDVPRDEGTYFTTLYHAGQTVYGHDWLLFQGLGTGWFVGAVQSMRRAHYCEGDEHFVLDGAVSPQFNGTGSEDYYLACFWPNPDFDTPFGCVSGNIQEEGGGDILGAYKIPSSYSRFHLEAPLPFFASVDARIQHGGLDNTLSEYRSLGFAYLNRRRTLRRTDAIDVGNAESEKAHGYRASGNGPAVILSASPEGEAFETSWSDSGRYHDRGEIRFRAAVDPANRGVRLRRRIDQKSPRQKAMVYVDGKYAGCWYRGYVNEDLRWADTDFEIHPDFTRGKNSLAVRLEVRRAGGEGAFTDFAYEVFSHLR